MIRFQVRPEYRWLASIVLLSVLLRLATAFYLGDGTVEALPGTHDQISYDALARNVAAGRGFVFDQRWYPFTPPDTPTAHWSFLYTGYLAACYALFGHHPLIPRLVQAFLVGLLTPILLYRIARRTFAGPFGAGASAWHHGDESPTTNGTTTHHDPAHLVGLAAAAAHTFYIYLVYYAATLMTEPFYILALLWSLDLLQRLPLSPSPPLPLLIQLGLAWSIAVLLRQQALLLIPFFLLWLLWPTIRQLLIRRSRESAFSLIRQSWRSVVLPLSIVALSILPFTVRNYLVYDAFLPLNSNVGWALYAANHPIQGTRFEPLNLPSVPPEYAGMNEAQLNTVLTADGIRFVLEDPGRFALQTLDRFRNYFRFWPEPESSTIANLSRVLSFGLYLPFMLYGLYLSLRRPPSPHLPLTPSPPLLTLLYLFILTYSALHLLSWAMHRYRLPVDAALMPFVGLALVDLYHRLAPRARTLLRTPTP